MTALSSPRQRGGARRSLGAEVNGEDALTPPPHLMVEAFSRYSALNFLWVKFQYQGIYFWFVSVEITAWAGTFSLPGLSDLLLPRLVLQREGAAKRVGTSCSIYLDRAIEHLSFILCICNVRLRNLKFWEH